MADSAKEKYPEWDLSDLYSSMDSPELKKDMSTAAASSERFEKRYKGKLAELSGDEFGKAIREYEKICETLGKVGTYSYLLRDTNLQDAKITNFHQNISEKSNDISTKTIFFGLEINKLSDEQIEEKMKSSEATEYKSFIKNNRSYKNHQLSDDLENMLHEKSVSGSDAWTRLYDETSAKLTYKVDGKELTSSEVSHLMSDPNEETRRKAFEAKTKVAEENAPLFGLITNTLAKDKQTEDKWRGFKRPISDRNISNQVEDEVVDALVSSVKKNYSNISHRYYKLKAKWLGKEQLEPWDRHAPLPNTEETIYSWEEAKDIVLKAYTSFSPEMAEIGKKFFDNDWIDVGVKEGKASGAFNHPGAATTAHAYIKLNFMGKADDVMTLAHELGHGIHAELAKKQGYLQAGTPITLAETASVFGEMVTFKSLVKAEKDPKKRLALIADKTESMIGTAVSQIAYHEFETKVHEGRKDGELSTEKLGEIWKNAQKESQGDSIRFDEKSKNGWGSVPHFIHTPFYVYAYAFGDGIVNSLYKVHEEGKTKDFQKKYMEMLSKGGTEGHKDMLKPFGLDASKPDFWDKGLEVVSSFIDDLEKISDELGMTKEAVKTGDKKQAKPVKQAKLVNVKALAKTKVKCR
ncbi:MAG: M3 family oligoendopeptidase [Alphaproteobacteria bacterium]|nr:M3 family oligoendopeptidase [Alphaproteobacteria bacterium]